MKATTALAALALIAAGLAFVPQAQAAVQPCPTSVGGCCGTFAPCCSVLACPPPITRVCLPPLSSSAMALPLPHVGVTQNPTDCTVTATETYDCPNGFWDSQVRYNAGPVHVVADTCTIQCACMPMSVGTVPAPLSSLAAVGVPITCVMAPCCSIPCPAPACASFHVDGAEASLWWSNSCRATVTSQDNLVNCVAEWSGVADPSVGPVSVVTPECGPICACMPASLEAAPALSINGLGLSSNAVNPCPYSAPGCCAGPCRAIDCSAPTVETIEARVTIYSRCNVEVVMHENLYNCVVQKTVTVGTVTIQPESCQPICACMPASDVRIDPLAIAARVTA